MFKIRKHTPWINPFFSTGKSFGSTFEFRSVFLGCSGGCEGGCGRDGFLDEFHTLALLYFEPQGVQRGRAGPRAQPDVFASQGSRRALLTVRESASIHIFFLHFAFAVRSADGCRNSRRARTSRNLSTINHIFMNILYKKKFRCCSIVYIPARNRLLDPWRSVAAGQLGTTGAFACSRIARGAKVMPKTGKMRKTNCSNCPDRSFRPAGSATAGSVAESFAAVASASPWQTHLVLPTGYGKEKKK